jgi:hypothetical protein
MTREGTDRSTARYRSLSDIIADIHEHRRRMEKLLARLDDLDQAMRVVPLAGDRVDAPTLLAQFSTNLRTDDGRLERLVSRLERHQHAEPAGSGL